MLWSAEKSFLPCQSLNLGVRDRKTSSVAGLCVKTCPNFRLECIAPAVSDSCLAGFSIHQSKRIYRGHRREQLALEPCQGLDLGYVMEKRLPLSDFA